MEISDNPFIRFLDLLVKKLEENKTEEEKEEDFIYGLKTTYLINVYNEANGTKLKRINFSNKNKNLYQKRTNEERTWTFVKFSYKNLRLSQTKNNIEMDENARLLKQISELELKLKWANEKIERLEKTIELLTLAYGEKIKSQHRIDPREK